MENNVADFVKKQDEIIKLGAKLYKDDKGHGGLLNRILISIEEDSIKTTIRQALTSVDASIFTKNDLIQKIALNRLLISHLLKTRARNDMNITAFLSILSYTTRIAEWEKIVKNSILPALIKNKIL